MAANLLKRVIVIFVITGLCIYISLPKEVPLNLSLKYFKFQKDFTRGDININLGKFSVKRSLDLILGLDLAGGSHLVFEADTHGLDKERKLTAMQGLKTVMERRVNLFGVSEPNVQISSFEDKDRIIVELPGIKDTAKAINVIGKTAQLVFAEVGTEESPGINLTDLTGANLTKAEVRFDQSKDGKPVVAIEFDGEGSKRFGELTDKNINKPLAILLDNSVISAPIVQEKISGGQAVISGDFTIEQAKNLSIQLNAGSLPVSVVLVEQRTVGASLGAESVQKSIKAGLIGLVMVMLFMVLSYGKFGVIADIALVIFGVVTLTIYKLFPVVLTLPGIAGFLLSVGMAVDSNILIFERFKEEIVKRDYINALEVSFGRAWDSIRDANIATLVTAFVLANPLDFSFLHTSGPVRGFAITLALGILVSMFTGIVVSRNLLRAFLREKNSKSGIRNPK